MKVQQLLFLVLCGLDFVMAQSSQPTTCNVTRTLDTTVPELCYARLNDLSPGRLNFTLVNGSAMNVTLKFNPLPKTRQVELEVVDNSDGLKAWTALANAFVDDVRSGSLPYGKLSANRYIEWAWSCLYGGAQRVIITQHVLMIIDTPISVGLGW